ncbi:MAG: hypothetical protein ACE5K4_06625 [Candidatus Hydrothermarchaeota archaeon]
MKRSTVGKAITVFGIILLVGSLGICPEKILSTAVSILILLVGLLLWKK